jgi:hypothetical protein
MTIFVSNILIEPTGGFPALVEQLMASRGTVEPVILNHEPEKWRHFLRTTGRLSLNQNSIPGSAQAAGSSSSSGAHGGGGGGGGGMNGGDGDDFPSTGRSPIDSSRRRSQMSDVEIAQLAYKVAVRLGHKNMEGILLDKINDAILKAAEAERSSTDRDRDGDSDCNGYDNDNDNDSNVTPRKGQGKQQRDETEYPPMPSYLL